jgi:hypothetical protein
MSYKIKEEMLETFPKKIENKFFLKKVSLSKVEYPKSYKIVEETLETFPKKLKKKIFLKFQSEPSKLTILLRIKIYKRKEKC